MNSLFIKCSHCQKHPATVSILDQWPTVSVCYHCESSYTNHYSKSYLKLNEMLLQQDNHHQSKKSEVNQSEQTSLCLTFNEQQQQYQDIKKIRVQSTHSEYKQNTHQVQIERNQTKLKNEIDKTSRLQSQIQLLQKKNKSISSLKTEQDESDEQIINLFKQNLEIFSMRKDILGQIANLDKQQARINARTEHLENKKNEIDLQISKMEKELNEATKYEEELKSKNEFMMTEISFFTEFINANQSILQIDI